ncbi:MAG TPA: FAD-dependent oxidoreductase [Clostridia bacterium]|nr:FAD-dependent oxidoreductase [Clostridia bacterium]
MKRVRADVAVVGAGPAGLAAALKARELGAGKVLLFERDAELGGVLQQCIHDGFGLHRFGRRMSGNQYAQAFIDELEKSGVEVKLDTMVLEVTPERTVYACNSSEGMLAIEAGAVILAMGCRERTASQVLICGDRPAGVLTAGAVQRYINMEGYLPGSRAVILGSGDIGLIMARRMTLEGIEVKAVYEVMPSPGGLTRNIVQCLDEFNIPLHLSTTVTRVNGRKRVESVTVAKVDEKLKPVPGTEETIECDLLVLAVGLIPENELSRAAGIELDPRTKGPVLDDAFMTSIPGVFACGNVAVVFDLVDYVSRSGEIAARGAVDFIAGKLRMPERYIPVEARDNVNFVVPQRLRPECEGASLFMRVKKPQLQAVLTCESGGKVLLHKRLSHLAPPEMLTFDIAGCEGEPVAVSIGEVEGK